MTVWQNYDIAFSKYDVAWDGVMASTKAFILSFEYILSIETDVGTSDSIAPNFTSEKTNSLYSEGQTIVNITGAIPILYLEGMGTITLVVTGEESYIGVIVQKALSPNFYTEKTIDLFGQEDLLPDFIKDLQVTLYNSGAIKPSLSAKIAKIYLLVGGTVYPILSSNLRAVELADTLIKLLTTIGWTDKTPCVYTKTDIDTWSSVPLYTKQIDGSWM